MKTFKDLEFKKQGVFNSLQAVLNFDNGYGVSVLFGDRFYSNGIDNYELAILYNGDITYSTGITDDVIGYINEDEVNNVMLKVQKLK
jgi:hypothetical protein